MSMPIEADRYQGADAVGTRSRSSVEFTVSSLNSSSSSPRMRRIETIAEVLLPSLCLLLRSLHLGLSVTLAAAILVAISIFHLCIAIV